MPCVSPICDKYNNCRGTNTYDEILDLANENTLSVVKKNQHSIKIDEPCCIQFTSVSRFYFHNENYRLYINRCKTIISKMSLNLNNYFMIASGYLLLSQCLRIKVTEL